MAYPRKIKNFSAFIDGFGYFGLVTEATLPQLQLDMADYRGAGQNGTMEIDMGTQKMQTEMTFSEWVTDPITMFGTRQRIVLRPYAEGEDDFTADSFIFTCGGRFKMNDFGTLKPGDDMPFKIGQATDFFRCEKNGTELFKIDVRNSIRVINGVDQMAEARQAMGL